MRKWCRFVRFGNGLMFQSTFFQPAVIEPDFLIIN